MIDNNKLEVEAMRLFKKGESQRARQLQTQFLEEVRNSGEDHCNCPGSCKLHGNCVECVIVHRGHGDHLPYCFQDMTNKRLEILSELTEHSFKAPSADA